MATATGGILSRKTQKPARWAKPVISVGIQLTKSPMMEMMMQTRHQYFTDFNTHRQLYCDR